MAERIEQVVILGGGTAGWMTATYLAKALQGSVRITVLEAPAIPRIGVGEATVPNLQRVFFDHLGLTEVDWMPSCNGSYKIAVKFVNWRTAGAASAVARDLDGRPDHFYHPFGLLPTHDGIPLSHYWAFQNETGRTALPFDYACFREPAIMDAMRAPRWEDGRQVTYYAWHFDASLVAGFLRRFAVERQGVTHVLDQMSHVLRDERGYITSLVTVDGRTITGDLFIDCSGFRGLLINQAMGEPFIDMSDHLLCDSAVATAVPYDAAADGVQPYTSAIAMPAGWTWRIPMLKRFGTGYVYSSSFATRADATEDFCGLWGLDPASAELNHIRFRVGRNRRSWVKNCVSIGLSSCFLEPLESTGIYFISAAIYQLARNFPLREIDPVLVNQFNREIEYMFDETRDFIQAHFYFSPRTDTPFWQANKELKLADGIVDKVKNYRAGLIVNPPVTDEGNYYGNIDAEFHNFWTNGSYYSIFTGLGLKPERTLPALTYKQDSINTVEAKFAEIQAMQRELATKLPSMYDTLRRIHGQA